MVLLQQTSRPCTSQPDHVLDQPCGILAAPRDLYTLGEAQMVVESWRRH
jgi:hypothetical protein